MLPVKSRGMMCTLELMSVVRANEESKLYGIWWSIYRTKEELEIKKKTLADPLTEMKKVEEMFKHNKEVKRQSEAAELQRASACIHAMPTLFPDDIMVPKCPYKEVCLGLVLLCCF